MIRELSVENIAIIDRASLTLEPGLTVLTGETGAGKSLLIDAINLALGGRADSDLVRAGASRGTVSLLAGAGANVQQLCQTMGIEWDETGLLIQRDVSAEGRSTVRLNGRLASVSQLREIGNLLIDLHGQHDHQALLVPERQIDFLDAWIGQEASGLLMKVAEEFDATELLRRRLSHLRHSRRDREQRVDMLSFQVHEIEQLGAQPGELHALQNQIERLKHVERLRAISAEALSRVSTEEGSALELLGQAVKDLELAASIDPEIESSVIAFREAQAILRDGVQDLAHYVDKLDTDPGRLEEAATRLDALRRVLRKYGDSEEAVLEHLVQARAELATLTDDGATEEEVSRDLEAVQTRLQEVCALLTTLRQVQAGEFATLVQSHLRELAMERAEFSVLIEQKPIDAKGADNVVFLFTANAGEPARSLSKVASGGEISRVMLSIKVASAGRAGVPTLIFDEVDTGLSGKAAAVTAKKLGQLAQHCQVIAISHLPQIAAQADHHFRIEKSVEEGRTVTRVVPLDLDERISEVARMLAGEEIGESALANAREMVSGRI